MKTEFTEKEIDRRIASEQKHILNVLGKIDLLRSDLRATRRAIRMWEGLKKKVSKKKTKTHA